MFTKAMSLALGATLVCAVASADVIVVSPLGPYTEFAPAILAASDGDIVLVKTGNYEGFTITGKSIAVIADVGADVRVAGVVVQGLGPSKTVVLDRVHSAGTYAGSTSSPRKHGLELENCKGKVRLEESSFRGAAGTADIVEMANCSVTGVADAGAGVRITNCSDVSFSRCDLVGGRGADLWSVECYIEDDLLLYGGKGGPGLSTDSSPVSVNHTTLEGGESSEGAFQTLGAPGILATQPNLVLVDVIARGGTGGEAYFPEYGSYPGAEGGSGIHLTGVGIARILDSVFEGGEQGDGWGTTGGALAPPITSTSTIVDWVGSSQPLGFTPVLRVGENGLVSASGEPGDLILCLAASTTKSTLLPEAKGTFCLDPSTLLQPVILGTVVGSQPVSTSVTIRGIPPGATGLEFYVQGARLGATGATLTTWNHVTVVDASF